MAVPSGAVITKKIVVSSALREEDLEVQVQTEANQYIPFALEEVNLDFQVIGSPPGKPEDPEVPIAATRAEAGAGRGAGRRRGKVEDRVAVADSAGLKAIVMDVESYAQMAALGLVVKQLPNQGRDQNIAAGDLGAKLQTVTRLAHQ